MQNTSAEVEGESMSSDRRLWQPKLFIPAVALLLLIYGLEMFLSARLESQTFDEPAHLYAGYGYWLRGDFGVNPEHPPLVKLVASLPLALVDKPSYPDPTNRFFRADSAIGGTRLLGAPGSGLLLNHARTAVSIFAFLLAVLVVVAGDEMFGAGVALFALTLFVFDPLLVAHGPLLGTDVGAACCIFATVYAFYRYLKRPSLVRLGVCAVAAGLALAAKHSAILIFPVLALLAATEVVFYKPLAPPGSATPPPGQGRAKCAVRLAASLLGIFAVAVTILWAFYGFRYPARPGGAQITPPTAVYLQGLHHPVEAKAIGFAERHHLLPEAYLYGFTDVTIQSRDGRVMHLFGKMYPHGRWFYFPAAFLIKSTIGFLLLLLLVPFSRALWRSDVHREVLFLAIPPLIFFGAAMTSKLDIGLRHVMPAIPFLVVLAAAGAVSLARQSRGWAWAVSVLLALHVASSLHAFPNYLPYSNEFFGGPSRTYRVLADSNAGWGGGLKALHAELAKRNITECWLGYSAPPNPANFGIPCKRLPTYFSMILDTGQQQAVPAQIQGPVFLSQEEPAGSFWGPDNFNPYRAFAGMQPAHVIAGEILEYDGAFDVNRIAAVSHYMTVSRLLRSGKVDDAVAQAKMAVALDPASLNAREALTSAYAARHQPDDATREFQAAMQLYGTVPPEFASMVSPPMKPLVSPQQ
jgi:4-amino-4-deoxy-L-arabinose transferase-like glycosyltransferase